MLQRQIRNHSTLTYTWLVVLEGKGIIYNDDNDSSDSDEDNFIPQIRQKNKYYNICYYD